MLKQGTDGPVRLFWPCGTPRDHQWGCFQCWKRLLFAQESRHRPPLQRPNAQLPAIRPSARVELEAWVVPWSPPLAPAMAWAYRLTLRKNTGNPAMAWSFWGGNHSKINGFCWIFHQRWPLKALGQARTGAAHPAWCSWVREQCMSHTSAATATMLNMLSMPSMLNRFKSNKSTCVTNIRHSKRYELIWITLLRRVILSGFGSSRSKVRPSKDAGRVTKTASRTSIRCESERFAIKKHLRPRIGDESIRYELQTFGNAGTITTWIAHDHPGKPIVPSVFPGNCLNIFDPYLTIAKSAKRASAVLVAGDWRSVAQCRIRDLSGHRSQSKWQIVCRHAGA